MHSKRKKNSLVMEGIHYVPFHSPNRVVRLKMSNKVS